jgi:hypothetical protein
LCADYGVKICYFHWILHEMDNFVHLKREITPIKKTGKYIIKVGNVRKSYISLKLLLNFSKEVQLNYDWVFYTTIVFSNFDDRLLFVLILFFGVILTLLCHTYCLVRGVTSSLCIKKVTNICILYILQTMYLWKFTYILDRNSLLIFIEGRRGCRGSCL